MKKDILKSLLLWEKNYQNIDFIKKDPIQFPHRYSEKRDIEISGFLTAYLSFGNRIQILKAAEILDVIMGRSPYSYLLSRKWEKDFVVGDKTSFYRIISYAAMNEIFKKLFFIYNSNVDLETALFAMNTGIPIVRLCRLIGVSEKSPQKKLNMFLRWMIRKNSPVDFGIWEKFSPADLIIPLDTHVLQVAYSLGLTNNSAYTLKNAIEITSTLSKVFPADPCRGDFALFGYGVNRKK